MARRPALTSSWSSAITKRAGFAFRESNSSLLMERVPLIRCQQRYLGYDQGTITRSAGNHQVPTDQFDSLLHFAEPNMLAEARSHSPNLVPPGVSSTRGAQVQDALGSYLRACAHW